ncbi:MAG TPA: choice-of-anchor O protein, partial [Anaerolineae bacterium]|nr:choice-of-anchor O protein [Anaerolineae bacterium]
EDNNLCADEFPVAEDGSIPDDITFDKFPKVLEWRQLPYTASAVGVDGAADDFAGDPNDVSDLDDQWWDNPFDVSKGHRGFVDGDFVMMMYAWAPNWNSNAVGNDHYNLYVRRSFDGGSTWTTTPASFCDASGVCGAGLDALEYYYGETIGEFVPYVWTYGAGAFEQARNVSLLHGNKVTILDPRYSPTGGLKQYSTIRTDWLTANADLVNFTSDDVLPYVDDVERDKSKDIMIYETGDNTTVAEGEAVPLDLFYSRATVYGDFYEWFDYVNDSLDGDPVDGELPMTVEVEPRWPWLENAIDDLSGEASVVLNPGGTFAYNVWNQWQEEILPDGHELIYNSDMIFRRLLYLTDLDAATVARDPVASILYVSTTQADYDDSDIILVGTGRDLDKIGNTDPEGDGIDNVRWWSDIEGHKCEERTWQFPPRGLIPGWHDFSFQVQDNEGNWSRPQTVRIWIGPKYTVYTPVITR